MTSDKIMNKHLTMQRLCGSYQYQPSSPADLRKIMSYDNALWAALSAPVRTLNGDPRFFSHLNASNSGSICVDEVKNAFSWLDEVLRSTDILAEEEAVIRLDEINPETGKGAQILKALNTLFHDELKNHVVTLDETRAAMTRLKSGFLKGDGIITESAVANTPAAGLFADITAVFGGNPNSAGVNGITQKILDDFLSEAQKYLEWASKNDSYAMLMPGVDMPPAYAVYRVIAPKIDQYFYFCQLLQLDAANALRFEEDPEALSPLDLGDKSAIIKMLQEAPLAQPNADGILRISKEINPYYRDDIFKLAAIFGLDEFPIDKWREIKTKFAPYEAYLGEKSGLSMEKLGTEKLKNIIADHTAIGLLRRLFADDSEIMDKLKLIDLVERLILYKQYYFRFIQSYISFFELFNPERLSMIQAGSLIMDGKHFDLCIRIDNIEAHKKISVQSNLFIIYMKATRKSGDNVQEQLIATAITAGSNMVFYRGKPGLLEGWDGNLWETVIIDILHGPICFWQSLTLPFLKMGNMISQKLEKLASAEAISNELTSSLQSVGKPATAKQGTMNNSMLILAGGVGFAAIFSGITYVFKQLSNMPGLHLTYYIMLIFICIMAPLIIYSLTKLYKRNLGMFLEAAGWAVNLRMKLDSIGGRFFSYYPAYPPKSRFIRIDTASVRLKKNSRISKGEWLMSIIAIILIITALLGGAYLYFYKILPASAQTAEVIETRSLQNQQQLPKENKK